MSGLKGFYLGAMLLMMAPAVCADDITSLVIVKSSDNSYFNQTIETLISHVDQAIQYRVIMADDIDAMPEPVAGSLYIGLGQPAVEAIVRLGPKTHAIHAYLTEEQNRLLKIGKRQRSILLDQPLRRYLAFSKLLLKIDSIGIISNAAADSNLNKMPILGQLELELKQYHVDPENKLLPVLRGLLQHNDALLMLPRRNIYNRDSLKGVLLTSYRGNKPVISYSPAHVKSGALASIYSSPVDIGRHLAILTNRYLQQKGPGGPHFEFARFYSISTNPRVAHALGLRLPANADLRAQLDRLLQ